MLKLIYVDPQSWLNLAVYDYNLLTNLTECNVIYCHSSDYDGPDLNKIDDRTIFNFKDRPNKVLRGLSYSVSLIRLVKIVKKERPDIVHIQWCRLWPLDNIVLKWIKRYTKQTVFTAHNIIPHGQTTNKKIIKQCEKYYKEVDKIIVHSARTKEELNKRFGIKNEKIYIIPHGILNFQSDKTIIKTQIDNLISKYNLSGKLIFGAFGKQHIYKGTDLIFDAWLSSKKLTENRNIRLLIVGEGHFGDNRSLTDNIIYINNFVSSETFEAYMRLSDVILLPYRTISQSGVLLEAVNLKIPFIVTDVGGLAEPLNIANVGWKIETPDVDSLKRVLEEVAENGDRVRQIKDDLTLWNKLQNTYSWTNSGNLTQKCYNAFV